ncbi:unnamed protein product [Cylicocyclus nassatus]|uniref:Uncharacterized protein n=1 Tax=Cylicocyclus nassatus TaxID=53992 RepID=A0AA36DS52_CYLNA|nr:unnamed protein product [Cylicocyclus nassatus]
MERTSYKFRNRQKQLEIGFFWYKVPSKATSRSKGGELRWTPEPASYINCPMNTQQHYRQLTSKSPYSLYLCIGRKGLIFETVVRLSNE